MIPVFLACIIINLYCEIHRYSTIFGGDSKFTFNHIEFEISIRYMSGLLSKRIDI